MTATGPAVDTSALQQVRLPRPVLVGGCPRSGTTLLGSLLGTGPTVLTVPEAEFKWTVLRAAPVDVDGSLDLAAVGAALQRDWRFSLWGIQAPTPGPSRIGYGALLARLVNAHGATVGKPEPEVFIDHTPANVRYAATLSRLLPDARFVHLVRDGRAVAASVLPLDWGPSSVYAAARWWAAQLSFGLAAAAALGPERVITVRYEDLVSAPEPTLRALRDFLDLPDVASTATDYQVQRYTARQHERVGAPPDPSRVDAWRDVLAPRRVEEFEAFTADLLTYLDYTPDHGPAARPATAWSHASEVTAATLRTQLIDKPRRVARRVRGAKTGGAS
jgi:hypothetical protein